MYPAPFAYHRATSVDHALRLLAEHPDAKLLAGGHSLLPMMKLRLATPEVLIDIGRIETLVRVAETANGVRIGALTTHTTLASDPTIAARLPLVAEAAGQIADPAVRNRGTLGGSIAHADPASDLPAVLVALGARIHLAGARGAREVAAADFFVGLLETALDAHEMITAVEVPGSGAAGTCYAKHEHPASGYAVCGAAAVVARKAGTVSSATLVFNGVTATPLVAKLDALQGTAAGDDAIATALEGLQAADPLADLHASGAYRLHLARIFGRRALACARDRAQG